MRVQVLIAVVTLLACERHDESRKSAALLDGPEEQWELGPVAFPPIGVLEGPETHALERPRLVSMDAEGRLHVLNGRAEIRSFTPEGVHLGSIGGEGEGPGEFRYILQYRKRDDGSWAVLAHGRSLRILAEDGTELGAVRFTEDFDAVNVRAGSLADGRMVAVAPTNVFGHLGPPARARVVRDTVSVFLLGWDGESRVLASIEGYPWRVVGDSWNAAPLAPVPSLAGAGRTVALTGGNDYVVRVLMPDDGRGAILRLSERPIDATVRHLRAWEEERRAFYAERGMRSMPPSPEWEVDPPERLPGYAQLVVDSEGCIWARRYGVPGDEGHTWDVLDPAGRFMAQSRTPERYEVSEIHKDLMLGVMLDELMVGRIVAFSLPPSAVDRACDPPGGTLEEAARLPPLP